MFMTDRYNFLEENGTQTTSQFSRQKNLTHIREREHLKLTQPMDQSCGVPDSRGFQVLSPHWKQGKLIS